MCNCDKKNEKVSAAQAVQNTYKETKQAMNMQADQDMILIRYNHGNRGQHVVKGYATGKYYGYRGGGDTFLVHRDDIKNSPHIFIPIETQALATNEPAPPPVQEFDAEAYLARIKDKWNKELDLQTLPGVTAIIEQSMKDSGFTTRDAIMRAGATGLQESVRGIGEAKAEAIIAYLEAVVND